MSLSLTCKNLPYSLAGLLLNYAIRIIKSHPEPLCQQSPNCRFAGTGKADEKE
jgi:hypothetical protein